MRSSIFDRKLSYGRGTSILFYGPPGTGKTMGAQVLAREIGLELYRIDLSQTVSKYIGETEKNLGAIFDEARYVNAVLFFDEADALFSKRTEVKESNDRYANLETSYLLQKIEECDGVCILATNRVGNFDDAFKRRIHYMVEFPIPSYEMRLNLWQSILPPEMPREGNIDFEFLAKNFEYPGSLIKNILLSASFMAAGKHKGLSMGEILEAVRLESAKIGKILWPADFAQYGNLIPPEP